MGLVADVDAAYDLVKPTPITTSDPVLAVAPTLKSSILDYLPVVGSAREFLFNYTTHNFEGALWSFAKLAVELTPAGAISRAEKGASVAAEVLPHAADTLATAARPVARRAAVQVQQTVGNAFRDEVATLLERAGFEVQKEVTKFTPFGRRIVDIEVSRAGKVLGGIETKWGKSRYHAAQRAKDWYLRKFRNYPTYVIRGPF